MKNKKPTRQQLFTQKYVLTGAALGAYFGIFFRPVREPSFDFAILLSVFATVVTLGFGAYKERSLPSLKFALSIFLRFTILILTFEARHLAYDYGERIATILLTIVSGAVIGYLAAKDRLKQLTNP